MAQVPHWSQLTFYQPTSIVYKNAVEEVAKYIIESGFSNPYRLPIRASYNKLVEERGISFLTAWDRNCFWRDVFLTMSILGGKRNHIAMAKKVLLDDKTHPRPIKLWEAIEKTEINIADLIVLQEWLGELSMIAAEDSLQKGIDYPPWFRLVGVFIRSIEEIRLKYNDQSSE